LKDRGDSTSGIWRIGRYGVEHIQRTRGQLWSSGAAAAANSSPPWLVKWRRGRTWSWQALQML
jgi:hypothetical protein